MESLTDAFNHATHFDCSIKNLQIVKQVRLRFIKYVLYLFKSTLQMTDVNADAVLSMVNIESGFKYLVCQMYEKIIVWKIECKNHLLRKGSRKIRYLVKDTTAGPLILRKISSKGLLETNA